MGRNGKNTPLYLHIYRNLRDEILSGKFCAGTILPSENSLCAKYGTSRHTVRTSLKKIDNEGLVRNLPGRGWEVVNSGSSSVRTGTKTLAFIGRGDLESASAFESVRRSYHKYFSDLKYHIKSLAQGAEWYDEFIRDEIGSIDLGGLVVFDDKPLPDNFVSALNSFKIPFVCLPLNGNYQYKCIGTDNLNASEKMMNCLFERGHRNIIFATCSDLDLIPSFRLRRIGYSLCMERSGLKPEIIMANHNYWQGREEEKLLMDRIMEMRMEHRAPTCIFCSTSSPVLEFLALLGRNSIDVPREISLCSFGSSPQVEAIMREFGIRTLTHIEEQFDVMGEAAIDILSVGDSASSPLSALVPVKLFEGDSVDKVQ